MSDRHDSRSAATRKKMAPSEANKLLGALEGSANAVIEVARGAASSSEFESYEVYARFRERVQDFESLATLVEDRLRAMSSARDSDLDEKFAELMAYMLGATISTSLHFLRIFAERDYLPVGSKEVFLLERRSLETAKHKLQSPPYLARLGERASRDIQSAEEILEIVIEKASSLTDFSDVVPGR
jgi:hypothetical protein